MRLSDVPDDQLLQELEKRGLLNSEPKVWSDIQWGMDADRAAEDRMTADYAASVRHDSRYEDEPRWMEPGYDPGPDEEPDE